MATPTNGQSYLESMSVSGGSPKASYSPFSNVKKAPTNDSLYNAPSTEVPQVEEEYPEVSVMEDSGAMATPTNGQSYLESMSVSEGSPKASYSPFGTPKIISNDSLYAPPKDGTSDKQHAAVNGGSYFDSLSGLNGGQQSHPKASYSPFGTPKVVTNDSLYGPPDMPIVSKATEASTPPVNGDFADTLPPSFSETNMSSNQGSYLNALNDSSESNLKTSYSPFGRKPQAVDDSEFYSPDNTNGAFSSSLPAPENIPSVEEEEHNTPVAPYLEGLTDPTSFASTDSKRSFSPFANGGIKFWGEISGSDISYKPPSLSDEIQSPESLSLPDLLPSEEERDSTPVANYLERLVIPLGDESADWKKSFSPFGDGGKNSKGQASGSDILYKPPEKLSFVSDVFPSDEERDNIPVSNYLERLVIPLSDAVSAVKKSFSPFGDRGAKRKWQASGSDISYNPPAKASFGLPSDEERDSTPVSNYLERLVIPLGDTVGDDSGTVEPTGAEIPHFDVSGTELMVSDTLTDEHEIMEEALYTEANESEAAIPDQIATYSQENNAPSYINSISGFEQPLKSSYSPFGLSAPGNFESSVSDLYTTAQSPESNDEGGDTSFEDERDNYLESLGDDIPFLKNSFSPFGSKNKSKPPDSSTDSLY